MNDYKIEPMECASVEAPRTSLCEKTKKLGSVLEEIEKNILGIQEVLFASNAGAIQAEQPKCLDDEIENTLNRAHYILETTMVIRDSLC